MMKSTFSRGLAAGLTALLAISPAVAKEKKPVDPNKMICRSDVPTGSRFPVRSCHTAAQWASIEGTNSTDGQALLDRARQTGLAGSSASSAAGR